MAVRLRDIFIGKRTPRRETEKNVSCRGIFCVIMEKGYECLTIMWQETKLFDKN